MELLIANEFDAGKPTFWLFEGVVMYININSVQLLLSKISKYCICGQNEIFVDIINQTINEKHAHFQWGLSILDAPSFFLQNGNWNAIHCKYCEHYAQGRIIGGKSCIFFNGIKKDLETV